MKSAFFRYVLAIFKSAAEDIPGFYPDWVKNHPSLTKYKSLKEIVKSMPVADYRENVIIDSSKMTIDHRKFRVDALKELLDELDIHLDKLDMAIIDSKVNGILKNSLSFIIEKIIKTFTSNIGDMIDRSFKTDVINDILKNYEDIKLIFPISDESDLEKTLFLPAGLSIAKMCKMLVEAAHKYIPETSGIGNELLDISKFSSYKRFAYFVNKKYAEKILKSIEGNLEIVFSTNAKDILSMSVRSDWISCQNLLLPNATDHNSKAIFSAISPYTGIIYLTNKKDYSSRGEEMVARSMIFYVENGKQSALILAPVYSNLDKQKIYDMFRASLSTHSKIPVITFAVAKTLKYKFPITDENEIPYFDERLDSFDKKLQ